MKFQYETAGNSSYLAAIFEGGEGIINYQLQMLVNNDIRNIVGAVKKQKNDDIQIFYNITSKITLEQATEKSKITKDGVIAIIRGALTALKDIEEYQFVSSGLVFEADKIFVKPGSFEPNFIYVPNTTEDNGLQSLKNLLLNLVMSSKIEVSNDNFVQVLLETLNKPGFGAGVLRKLCDKYNGTGAASREERKEKEVRKDAETSHQQVKPPMPQPNRPIQIPGSGTSENKPPRPKMPVEPPKAGKTVKEEKKPKAKKEKSNMPLFVILQIALLALVGAAVYTGVLNDEAGNLNLQYLCGILLAVFAVDFVLYREMFKNNKEKESKKEKNTKSAKKPPVTPMPGKKPQVAPKVTPPMPKPAAVPQSTAKTPPVPERKQENKIPPVAVTPVAPVNGYNIMDDFENEDTVVIEDNVSSGAYLEFYDNGIASRINLNKSQVVVGKLRTQCDFVLNNRKISKMHAEFTMHDGQYFVKDFNSTNGTYINGANQRIQSNREYQIFNGDRITLADVDMTLFC